MSFSILNDADVFNANQAEIDKVDIDILVAGVKGDGVIAGCAVTAQGSPDMTVAVAAGLIRYEGKSVVVASGNVTIGTADGTHPRFDLITVNNSGTKACTAGTAAADPVFPSIPANSVVLAAVYVPASDTTIASNQITDKRMVVSQEVIRYKAADETVNNSNVFQDDDDLKFDADANSLWDVVLVLFHWGSGTADIKVQWTVPSGATFYWGPAAGTGNANPVTSTTPYFSMPGAATANTALLTTGTLIIGGGSTASAYYATVFRGLLVMSSTAGTLQLQWAQNSATSTDNKTLKGSSIRATRLGT